MDQIIVPLDPPLLLHNIASLWKCVSAEISWCLWTKLFGIWKFISKLFQDHETHWDL